MRNRMAGLKSSRHPICATRAAWNCDLAEGGAVLAHTRSGHHDCAEPCPLLGVKRTSCGPSLMSANDPKRTLAGSGTAICRLIDVAAPAILAIEVSRYSQALLRKAPTGRLLECSRVAKLAPRHARYCRLSIRGIGWKAAGLSQVWTSYSKLNTSRTIARLTVQRVKVGTFPHRDELATER
jgi:hypothetical protein